MSKKKMTDAQAAALLEAARRAVSETDDDLAFDALEALRELVAKIDGGDR